MAVKDFHKVVHKHGGYVLSDGTCNLKHLLPKAFDFIRMYNMRDKKGVADLILMSHRFEDGYDFDHKKPGLFAAQYYGHATLIEDDYQCVEDNNWLWHEEVFNYFNDIAPRGYYFGHIDGDGACIGWFRQEDDES